MNNVATCGAGRTEGTFARVIIPPVSHDRYAADQIVLLRWFTRGRGHVMTRYSSSKVKRHLVQDTTWPQALASRTDSMAAHSWN